LPEALGVGTVGAMKTAPSISSPTTARELRDGVALMVVAMLILPGIDAIAKGLAGSVPAGQIAWVRLVLQTLLLLPFGLRAGGLRIAGPLWPHMARGFLIAATTVMFFSAVAHLPLADAISIFFVSPLLLTLLSAAFLGEPIGWRRSLAVLAGFGGALLIVRPSFAVFGAAALLPLGSAVTFALYMVLTRRLARDGTAAGAVAMQFHAGLFGALAMTGALLLGPVTGAPVLALVMPDAAEWGWLFLLGVIATGGHVLVVLAVRRIGAGLIAPFQYLEIVSATTLGLVVFGDFPDATTWLGVAIIVASGLFVYYRERKLALAP
jgi:S-adenosylmethionine uptake transporter